MYKFKIRNGYNLKRLISQYNFFEAADDCLMYKKVPWGSFMAIEVNVKTNEVSLNYSTLFYYTGHRYEEEAESVFAKLIKNKVIIVVED